MSVRPGRCQGAAIPPSGRPGPRIYATSRPAAPRPRPRRRQSLLYCSASLFDPDQLFNRLEPNLRFAWTCCLRSPLLATAIAAAAGLVWTERRALISQFPHALRWETLVLAWLTVIAITTCHEFAHGLTRKHHGGEVHEIGFLLMHGPPCFFCNVSMPGCSARRRSGSGSPWPAPTATWCSGPWPFSPGG